MNLDHATLQAVALGAAAAGVIGVLLGAAAHVRIGRLRRTFTILQAGDGRESFLAAASRQHAAVDGLRGDVGAMQAQIDRLRVDVGTAVRHVAVVRYDAFQDMGGRLSFSAALLDDSGDGMVVTSINGRSETRTYAKGIVAGRSDHNLSPEESQAIEAARTDVARAGSRG